MRKVCIVTGSRAEYGLLKLLIDKIDKTDDLKLQLVVSGMHLHQKFGNTISEIKNDGYKINSIVDINLDKDKPKDILKSISLGINNFSLAYTKLKPDCIVILGDRYEIFSAAISGMFLKIPIMHIHGGELTESMLDDAIRHSITKMSQFHFVANEVYRKRVIQLGENPKNVFCVGGLGVDNIKNIKLKNKKLMSEKYNIKFRKKNLLITFHPVTLEKNSETQINELLKSLGELNDTSLFFTSPNADIDNNIIFENIKKFVNFKQNSYLLASLGSADYLSLLKIVDAVVGNSSSGILEAPSLKKATINIGNRQNGRLMASSIINTEPTYLEIKKSLIRIYKKEFQNNLKKTVNPYGKFGASNKILKKIKKLDLKNCIIKSFYDLKF